MMKIRLLTAPVRCLLVAFAASAALALAGCHHAAPPPAQASHLTPQQMQGQQLFAQNCAGCHHAHSREALHGPGLEGVFRQKYLPSGLPATDQRVSSEIEYGRNMMPPFGNQLSNQQIQDIVAYLHTL